MKEVRNLNLQNSEVRANKEKRTLEGYAAVFNSESNPIMGQDGFTEIIKPNAMDGVLPKSDVLALLDHDKSRGILARSRFGEGTLELKIDSRGLKYSFEAPGTALGDEALIGVQRGDINSSSFSFVVAEDEWERRGDGSYLRTILKFEQIFDVSPVLNEAYSDTSVAVRSLQEFRDAETKPEVIKPEDKVPETKPEDKVKPDVKAEPKPTLEEINRHYAILDDKMSKYN